MGKLLNNAGWKWLWPVVLAAVIVVASGRGGVAAPDIIAFDKVAHAAGFAETAELRTLDEVGQLIERLRRPTDGPRLFVLKIAAENPPRSLPPRDATFVKNRFRAHLGLATC